VDGAHLGADGHGPDEEEGTHLGADGHGPEGEEGTHLPVVGTDVAEADDTLKLQGGGTIVMHQLDIIHALITT